MKTPDIIFVAPFSGKKGNHQDYVGMAWDKPDDSCEHVAYVRRDLIEGMIRDMKERIEQEGRRFDEFKKHYFDKYGVQL